MYKLLLFIFLAISNILWGQAYTDSLAMVKVFEIMTKNQIVSDATMRITVRDVICADKKNAYTIGVSEADTTSSIPLLFILRDQTAGDLPQKLGFKGRGELKTDSCYIYWLYLGDLNMYLQVPIYTVIDTIIETSSDFKIEFRTFSRKTSGFKLKNPPKYLYVFSLTLKKNNDLWELHKIKKKKWAKFEPE